MVYYDAAQALPMYEDVHRVLQGINGLFGEVNKVFTVDIPVVFQGDTSAGIQAREQIVMDKFQEVDAQLQGLIGQAAPDEVQELVDLDRRLGD